MYIAGAELTGILDNYCMREYGMEEIVLMENAAATAVKRILKIEDEMGIHQNILLVCGTGNNGGDGYVIARKLYNIGRNVKIITFGNIEKLSPSAKKNYRIAEKMGIDMKNCTKGNFDKIYEYINHMRRSHLIIDCLFGAGLNRDIKGIYHDVIDIMNRYKEDYDYKIISIDIPSGLNGTTGEVMGISVEADYTITFEFYKKGFLRYGNKRYVGKVYVEKIGVPYKIYNNIEVASFIDEDYVLDNLIVKESYSNKGNFGKIAIVAGSNGLYGAAYLCGKAAMTTGSGLITVVCEDDVQKVLATRFAEVMTCPINDYDRIHGLVGKIDAIGFGPGMGNNEKTTERLKRLLNLANVPMVIDADGINVFKRDYLTVEDICILTPHLGEFSRLTGLSIEEINRDRIEAAERYARENSLYIVLKGENTIVTDGYRTMVNTTGNQGMARGGMGDSLTGMIVSFIGQGYEVFEACAIAVYIHGLCGDRIFEKSFTVNAEKLIDEIPVVMRELYDKL